MRSFPEAPSALPQVTVRAPDDNVPIGSSVPLAATVSSPTPYRFEWRYQNQPVSAFPSGLTGSDTLTLRIPFATTGVTGKYSLTATNAAGSTTATAFVRGNYYSLSPPRVVNFSARARTASGDGVFISGFVVRDAGSPKPVLVRAVGPGLAQLGVPNPAPAVSLQFFRNQTLIGSNSRWSDDPRVAPAAAGVGAFSLPAQSADSALLLNLTTGPHTAQVRSVTGQDGDVLAEVYELDDSGKLFNCSVRGLVNNAVTPLTLGFVLRGDNARQVLLRAIGPSLSSLGVTGVLANPRIDLFAGPTLILSNIGYATAPNSADIRDSAGSFGAFPLPTGSKDSAILTDLPAGAYTVRVTSADGTPGVALIEFYAGER